MPRVTYEVSPAQQRCSAVPLRKHGGVLPPTHDPDVGDLDPEIGQDAAEALDEARLAAPRLSVGGSPCYAGICICLRRLLSNVDAGTKRRSRLIWLETGQNLILHRCKLSVETCLVSLR